MILSRFPVEDPGFARFNLSVPPRRSHRENITAGLLARLTENGGAIEFGGKIYLST